MKESVIPSTTSDLEELANILGWKIGILNIQLGSNGKKIKVGSTIVYKTLNVSVIFVCSAETFIAESKNRKGRFHEQIERVRVNNILISKSFTVPILTVRPIEKPT